MSLASAGGTVDVTVRALAAGGAGVGDLPDGRVVFVQRTAPGDEARIRVEKSRPRWAEGSLVRLLAPSPDRVEPPCSLYGRCGGCQLQHLPYEKQLSWKGRIVADALERIGGLPQAEPPTVVPSPHQLAYRSRVTFTLRRLRGGHLVAGYHALHRPAHVVDVHGECLLADPALIEAWRELRACWGDDARHLPAGGRIRLTLRLAGSGVELLVEGGAEGWDPAALSRHIGLLSAVWHRAGESSARPALVAGESGVGGGTAFEQVNREGAELLRAHVLDAIEARQAGGGRAVDAYCGAGAYGRELAARAWTVTGIEVDPEAAALARRDAPAGFEVVEGAVEEHLAAALPAELVVLNPPRSGFGDGVADALVSAGPDWIVYVSCDPGTLARDLKALAGRYRLDGVRCFDLFPQTAHVETVAVLQRDGAPR